MNEHEDSSEITLDDPADENKKPLHIWQRPDHDSIEAMTRRQRAALALDREIQIEVDFTWEYEEALLCAEIPVRYIAPILTAISSIRERERVAYQAEAVRELLWTLDGADGAAKRRVMIG